MSSSDRRTILGLLAALPMAACGFAPAYAPGGPAAGLPGQVRADDPTTKAGFDLVERLEERLGRGRGARFRLTYAIATRAVPLGVTRDNAITRFNLEGSVDWGLIDNTTGARITGGKVQGFTSYSATGSTVAGFAASEDAAYRLMRLLADQIVTRLIASSGSWPA